MSSVLDTFTRFVNSPGGVFTAGAVVAGIVWKFFERVEAVLTEQTKFEIAVWLVGLKTEKAILWPDTVARIFGAIVGNKAFTLNSIYRSVAISITSFVLSSLYVHQLAERPTSAIFISSNVYLYWVFRIFFVRSPELEQSVLYIDISGVAWLLIDYISILKTRLTLSSLLKRQIIDNISAIRILAIDGFLTLLLIAVSSRLLPPFGLYNILPCAFTTIWLWLYITSGYMIKVSRRFDLGFQWFNRKFDIEKKPLQSIGLVAGAIVAVGYWTGIGLSRLL